MAFTLPLRKRIKQFAKLIVKTLVLLHIFTQIYQMELTVILSDINKSTK